MPRERTPSAGFTTTELVVTLLIIGIIAAIALPRMSNDPVVLSTQAEQLANDIRYVQSLAMTQGQRYVIKFPSVSSYQFIDSAGNAVPHPLTGSLAATNFSANVVMTALPVFNPGGGNALGFNGLGTPYSVTTPPAVPTFNGALNAGVTITLTIGTANQNVTIAMETGRVTP